MSARPPARLQQPACSQSGGRACSVGGGRCGVRRRASLWRGQTRRPPFTLHHTTVNATVLGASHQLYAHVHHGYGLNDAFDRAVTLLLARQRQQAAPGHSGTAGGSPDDIARQQQQQEQQQEQQQGAAASAAAADPGSGSGSGLSAAEKAGVAASAADKAAAAGAAEVATAGGRRALLQAPAALRRRLALSARGGEPQPQRERQGQGDEQQADQAPRGDRQLGQADGPPEVAHPCLHAGYRAPYRRRQQDGEAEPDPPQVMLVGR